MFGRSKDGRIYGFGHGNNIQKIYLFTTGEFVSTGFNSIGIKNSLFRFGEINEIKNSDIMEAVISLKEVSQVVR